MKLIGKGSFTKAYRKDSKTVILHSVDMVKECMSMGWFPSSNLFPTIKKLEYGETSTYEMKLYEKVTAPKKQLTSKHYETYKELRKIHGSNADEIRGSISNSDISHKIKEHLNGAIDALMNYGEDIVFEISPRNIATTKTGKLILLDCFYFRSALSKVRV